MPRFGRSFYVDGPKQKELLTYDDTKALLEFAAAELPTTIVGISVLSNSDEKYKELRALCQGAKFCELNLKYSFRISSENQSYLENSRLAFDKIITEVKRFCEDFADIPVFIKIPRELSWLPGTKELADLIQLLKAHAKAGIILANSLRLSVPPFLAEGAEILLDGGVMCGERLFDETITLIQQFRPICLKNNIPIIATGGLISPEQVLMAFWAGAEATQLCTAFVYNKINYYQTLIWYLQNRVEMRGLKTFDDYRKKLRDEGAASVYATPFMYYDNFWDEHFQKRIQQDVRNSTRMDVFVMSGKTLAASWANPLRQRFSKNRGLRLVVPRVDGAVYLAIQKSWGMTDLELEARKERVKSAIHEYEALWQETASSRGTSTQAEFGIFESEKCPFYSFYVFDDKVYVALYPFSRPGDLGSPVYVFSAGSPEYERIAKEADTLVAFAVQGSAVKTSLLSALDQSAKPVQE